jgi:DNA-binding NarL/FixJ family response regulator
MNAGGQLKLLIAEDREPLRRVIGAVVARLAGEVRECASVEELEKMLNTWSPDFVLIDGDMKALDGIAATRLIRAIEPSVKVIVVSSYDSPELREAAIQAGAVGYVLKDDLLELNRLLLAHR